VGSGYARERGRDDYPTRVNRAVIAILNRST
jgi:hypothetical protein